MEWTAHRLIPTILAGGVVMGLLASTAINTSPKGPAEPPWRLAAREAGFSQSDYAYVDHGPIDLSPNLPWIGTGPEGNVAPMPEDFYRGRIVPIRTEAYAIREPAFRPASYETADEPRDERAQAVREAVDEPAANKPLAQADDEPRFRVEAPRISDDAEEDEGEDLGG